MLNLSLFTNNQLKKLETNLSTQLKKLTKLKTSPPLSESNLKPYRSKRNAVTQELKKRKTAKANRARGEVRAKANRARAEAKRVIAESKRVRAESRAERQAEANLLRQSMKKMSKNELLSLKVDRSNLSLLINAHIMKLNQANVEKQVQNMNNRLNANLRRNGFTILGKNKNGHRIVKTPNGRTITLTPLPLQI
jgi:regulator of protease activity HflC (stomatin/prohibitin superfamily)